MPHQDYVGSDGQVWPSVTQLTRLLPQGWLWAWYKHSVEKDGWAGWCANKKKSEDGMALGTQVHSEIEGLIKGEQEACNEAQALYDHVEPCIEEWVEIEPHLICNEHKFAGTADAIVEQSNSSGLWVLDWKTSFSKDDAHPIQLAAYAMAWNESREDKIDKGLIVRVDKKDDLCNVKVDEYLDLHKYFPIVIALRAIWGYTEHEGVFAKPVKIAKAKKAGV